MSPPDVELDHISKRFGTHTAVDNVSLAVAPGDFVTLLGPSGCGKTTLLRIIGGFVAPDSGSVRIAGEDASGKPPHRRPTAMVFQRYALFPHLTVEQNVDYGLRMRRVPASQRRQQVADALALVDLAGFESRLPDQLSGGQQQRVALARSLVLQPTVLLLDEPLTALDANLRRQMQDELLHLQRRTGITFIAVTHDQEEALAMSSHIAVMNAGRIEQTGTPAEIFDQPRTSFVARFLGAQILTGVVTARDAALAVVRIGAHDVTLPGATAAPGETVTFALRANRIRLAESGWPATVTDVTFKGTFCSIWTRLPGDLSLRIDLPHDGRHHVPRVGETVHLCISATDLIPLAANAGDLTTMPGS